jgi:hypothetical protein
MPVSREKEWDRTPGLYSAVAASAIAVVRVAGRSDRGHGGELDDAFAKSVANLRSSQNRI